MTREGNRELLLPFTKRLRAPLPIYLATVERRIEPTRREIYRINLEVPLPSFTIPLRVGDGEPTLALQLLIEQAYRNGLYCNMDHRRELEPALPPTEAHWVAERLRVTGKVESG